MAKPPATPPIDGDDNKHDVKYSKSSKIGPKNPFARKAFPRKLKALVLLIAIVLICKRLFGSGKMTDEQRAIYISENLGVEYKALDNLYNINPENCQAQITLTNNGSDDIVKLGWRLYFYYFRYIYPEVMKKEGKVTIEDPGVVIHHVNGPLFFIEPLESFVPWEKASSKVIKFESWCSIVARTDLMPNWYVTLGEAPPKVIRSTASENLSYVAPFTAPRQWKQGQKDLYHPYTPQERYDHNAVADEGTPTRKILPNPLQVTPGEGSLILDEKTWVIVASDALQNEAQFLSSKTGLKVVGAKPKDKYILLELQNVHAKDVQVSHETYALTSQSKEQTILIVGQGSAGVFYGIQSFLSLLEGQKIDSVMVFDSPRFPYRGFMLDVARNFFGKDEVKKIIDLMAMYKLNCLHLHLADDEGWRIEIPDLPELTEVGARRGHDPTELNYLLPTLGSGPDPTGLGCGYFTQHDYKEILRYAADRHITVIPEIDMPGHSNAAIKSMRARYHKYHGSDEDKASQYLLHDLHDASHYRSVQMFKENVINPCLESSYTFVDKVLQTLIDYHMDIQPLKTFHLGGDEVPSSALKDSPACKQFFEIEGPMTMGQMKEHFVRRVIKLAAARGLEVQAWEDAFYGHDKNLFSRSALQGLEKGGPIANAWISAWGSGKAHRAHEMANHDYKVIFTSATHLYFDHHHEPDPEERGLYWATRFIDLRKVFNFMPQDFWANMDTDRHGHPINREVECSKDPKKCLALEKTRNIIGMEAALWGETVRTVEHLHFMVVLRLLALAERSWHRASWEAMAGEKLKFEQQIDWTQFVNQLGYKELPKLEREGFAYYLPLPGAKKENGVWRVNTAIPNHVVQFSEDDGNTWNDLTAEALLPESKPFKLATRSFDRKRRSRVIDVRSVLST